MTAAPLSLSTRNTALRSSVRRHPRAAIGLLLLGVAGLIALAVLVVSPLDALRAAGLVGTEPAGGGVFKQMISTLQSNTLWLIATGIGMALTLVCAMLIFGVQRAPDHFFRIAGGVAALLVVVPAVMS